MQTWVRTTIFIVAHPRFLAVEGRLSNRLDGEEIGPKGGQRSPSLLPDLSFGAWTDREQPIQFVARKKGSGHTGGRHIDSG